MSDRRFDLVIFDCDGVLVDTERLMVELEAIILTEMGWPMDATGVVERFVGRTHEYMTAELSRHLGRELDLDWDEPYRARYDEAFDRVEPVDGIVDALDTIVLPTCVASSGSHRRIRRTLGHTGLLTRFEGRIYSADDVGRGKPWPDLFLHAAASMGTAPDRCIVVEDSAAGVTAARAAGMAVLAYGSGVTRPELLAGAGGTLFWDMRDLPGLVG